jgi:hypothetical protein
MSIKADIAEIPKKLDWSEDSEARDMVRVFLDAGIGAGRNTCRHGMITKGVRWRREDSR